MRISDWSSDVCSSDLAAVPGNAAEGFFEQLATDRIVDHVYALTCSQFLQALLEAGIGVVDQLIGAGLFGNLKLFSCRGCGDHFRTHGFAYFHRSEEHTSELQSLMRISYAVFCLKKKNTKQKLYTSS